MSFFRYKAAAPVENEEVPTISQAVYRLWVRTFWPMKYLICDQGGAFASVGFGICLDKWGVERILGGAETGIVGKHTKTGLVERHAGLLKLTMRKLAADALMEGIELSAEDLAA